jgi:hypothetical protein
MWHYVVGWVLRDISNDRSALKTPRTAHPTRKHNVPEDCCENVTPALYTSMWNIPGFSLDRNTGCHLEIFHCFLIPCTAVTLLQILDGIVKSTTKLRLFQHREFCRLGNASCVFRGMLCYSCGRLKRYHIYCVNHPPCPACESW